MYGSSCRGGEGFHRTSGGMFLDPEMLNITSGVITKILFDDIIPGYTDGIEDTVNNRLVPGVPGSYLICGQISYTEIVPTKNYELKLQENGVIIHQMYEHSSIILGELTLCFAKIIIVNLDTDFYELYARQNTGVDTIDIENGIHYTYLMMQRIR